MRSLKNVAGALVLLASAQVVAQTPASGTASGPEAVRLFANQRDSKVVEEGWKHFYFHRSNTSYEAALADLTECYRFVELSDSWLGLPAYVVWGERAAPIESGPNPTPMVTGVVAAMIGRALIKTQNRRAAQSRLRRCMEPRGYQRYPLSEADWQWLIADFTPETLPQQAKIASGPKPDAEPLLPSK